MEKCIVKNKGNLVGEVIREGKNKFTFVRTGKEYCDGFMFEDANGKLLDRVTIDHPFAIIQNRVPKKENPRATELMKQYGIKEYDEWELLKLSSGRMLGDKIEFLFEKIGE